MTETLNFGNIKEHETWRINYKLLKAFKVTTDPKEKFSPLPTLREYLNLRDFGQVKDEEENIISFIPKCEYKMCFHHGEHSEGSCMHITQDDLIAKPTMKKFCPCGANSGDNHRRYAVVGFMEVDEENDHMITKKCDACGLDLLLNKDTILCMGCRN